MTCDEARLHIGGYVLDGLTPEEAGAVHTHLATCTACRKEYESLRTLPELMAAAIDAPPAPPGRLREQVLTDAAANHASARQRGGRNWTLQLVAALVIGALIGGTGVWIWRSPSARPSVTTTLTSGEGFEAQGVMELQPTDNGVRVELALAGLSPLSGDEVYEVWFAHPDTGPLSYGTFRPDANGSADVTLWAAGPMERYRSMWVTLEPDFADPAHDGPTVVETRLP